MPTTCSDTPVLITFRGGFVADWRVVSRLLEIEARGGIFESVEGGRFRVRPGDVLTPADRIFLRARRDEVRRVIDYYDASAEACS